MQERKSYRVGKPDYIDAEQLMSIGLLSQPYTTTDDRMITDATHGRRTKENAV